MFHNLKCLKIISNLTISQKLRYEILSNFCSKVNNYELSTDLTRSSVVKLLDEAATLSDEIDDKWVKTSLQKSIEIPKEEKPKKPKINPADTSVIIFPGQGIIKVGDVNKYLKFPRVKELFDIANEILGFNLLKICLKGPQEILNRTEFNQPATVVSSLAALEKLQDERPSIIESCVAVAGYSIGELTGLIFSDTICYEEGLKLVAARANAMQKASDMSPQGMLVCHCSPSAKMSEICSQAEKWAMDIGAPNPICSTAIYLCTESKIIGGCNEALEFIIKNSKSLGLRKVQRLPVSGAFHTKLMKPTLKQFIKALDKTTLGEPQTKVYANLNAKTYSNDHKYIRQYLISQIISPVKWEQILQKIYTRPPDMDYPKTFDVGSQGKMKVVLNMTNSKAAKNCWVY